MTRRFRNHMRRLLLYFAKEEVAEGVPVGTEGTPMGLLLLITYNGS